MSLFRIGTKFFKIYGEQLFRRGYKSADIALNGSRADNKRKTKKQKLKARVIIQAPSERAFAGKRRIKARAPSVRETQIRFLSKYVACINCVYKIIEIGDTWIRDKLPLQGKA